GALVSDDPLLRGGQKAPGIAAIAIGGVRVLLELGGKLDAEQFLDERQLRIRAGEGQRREQDDRRDDARDEPTNHGHVVAPFVRSGWTALRARSAAVLARCLPIAGSGRISAAAPSATAAFGMP